MDLVSVLEVRLVLCGSFESSLVVACVALSQTEPLLYSFERLLFCFVVFLLDVKHKVFHCCWQWMEFWHALILKPRFWVHLL